MCVKKCKVQTMYIFNKSTAEKMHRHHCYLPVYNELKKEHQHKVCKIKK